MFLDHLLKLLYTFIARRFKVWRRHKLIARAKTWPQAPGSGLEAYADCAKNSSYAVCSAEVNYTYRVNGELFAGSVSLPADDNKHANGLALGWRNREILVRYSPSDPAESTVLLEDQPPPSGVVPNKLRTGLRPPLVVNRKFKPRIRRKQLRHFFQALCHLRRCQQRIVALAQIVVVHIDEQRQQIDGDGIGKAGG